VASVRCLKWPPQAAEWLTQIRKCGWPDTATIQRVVNTGCDLVHEAHCQCTDDEWYTRMFRISFSRAETILLNSWSPTQQMAYHLLRYVIRKISIGLFDFDFLYTNTEDIYAVVLWIPL